MIWARVLADGVVAFHALYVGFVVFGMAAIVVGLARGWRGARDFWFRTIHLAAIGVVAAQALAGVICPLTLLENHLRRLAGQQTYPGAFIGYWAHRFVFFRAAPWVFTLGYSLFGLAVLAAFLLGPPRWPKVRGMPVPGRRSPEDKPPATVDDSLFPSKAGNGVIPDRDRDDS